MKKIEVIIIILLSMIYFVFVLYFSSVINLNTPHFFVLPTKTDLALIGAFVAFYNVMWNIYKYVKENKIIKSIDVSVETRLNGNDFELSCSFKNKSPYPVKIEDCYSRGFYIEIEPFEIIGDGTSEILIKGKRDKQINICKTLFGNIQVFFNYRFKEEMNNYKRKSVKIDYYV